MHEFEEHQRKQGTDMTSLRMQDFFMVCVLTASDKGKEVQHGLAKEMLAGFAGAGVDYLAETKGADLWDKEAAKHDAKKKSEQLYDQYVF